MSVVERITRLGERTALPDSVTRAAVSMLVGRTRRRLAKLGEAENASFAKTMADFPVALNAAEANDQHYEIPEAFFSAFLGPHRKYSCCFYEGPETTLAEAEAAALKRTAEHADLRDGQTILELGCGWGSMTLWMARTYPAASITAVSNSASQRAFIEAQAARDGLSNLTVITQDMNTFEATGRYDRIVSIEMFEHMSNWIALLQRTRSWIADDGRMFIHVFSHRTTPYRFDRANKSDWIAQHFFTGGIMPSHKLMHHFGALYDVEQDWRWNGEHYRRTAADWLANFDANQETIAPILTDVYGAEARLWNRRWRLFLMATMGLFGHAGGREWGVSHYLLKPA